ncbi:MAG: Crp/Fnr family transcriptional regulator [Bacteroidales bacterium]
MITQDIYSWAGKLKESEIEQLLKTSVLLDYNKGEAIIKQGTMASHIMFLEEGMAKLNLETAGRDTTFNFAVKGDFIGLMCSFVQKRLEFSAIAITPSKVRIFDRDVFEKFIGENGEFAVYIVTMMSEMTNGVVHALISLSHKNANGALAMLILSVERVFRSNKLHLPFTREEMAATLGYSKESIINTMSDFQRDGIISISGRNLEILNKNALQIIADKG